MINDNVEYHCATWNDCIGLSFSMNDDLQPKFMSYIRALVLCHYGRTRPFNRYARKKGCNWKRKLSLCRCILPCILFWSWIDRSKCVSEFKISRALVITGCAMTPSRVQFAGSMPRSSLPNFVRCIARERVRCRFPLSCSRHGQNSCRGAFGT